jgi:hypothetical protein
MKTTMEGPRARYLRCNDGDGHGWDGHGVGELATQWSLQQWSWVMEEMTSPKTKIGMGFGGGGSNQSFLYLGQGTTSNLLNAMLFACVTCVESLMKFD